MTSTGASTPTNPTTPPAAPRRPAGSPTPVAPPTPFAALDPVKLLKQYYPFLVAAGILGGVLGYGTYYVLRKFYPRWDAVVQFEALPEPDSPDSPIGAGGNNRDEMEAHMNTMVRVMSSDLILDRAVQERTVRDTLWAAEFKDATGAMDRTKALRRLRQIVNARAIPDTKIMTLRVGTRHKDDAPNIANAVATVFLDDTQTRSSKDMRDLIQEFEGQVRGLSKDLTALEQRQETLLASANLTSLRQESTVQQNEVQNLQPTIVEMREQLTSAREQLNRYETMANNPGGAVIPEIVRQETERGPLVQQQDSSIAAIKAEIRARKGEFGENHPDIKRLERRLNAQQEERNALVDRLMGESFSTVIENLRNQTQNLEASLLQAEERLRGAERALQDITVALKQHDDMTMDYTQKLAKKAEMERRVADMNLMLARGARVRMLSSAQVPDELAFPKLIPTTAIAMVMVVGLVGGLIALKEIQEQRIRGPHDVALIPRTRVIGVVPDLSMDPSAPERIELIVRDRPNGVISESFRQLRHYLCKEAMGKGIRSLAFDSGLPGSGASAIVSNVAVNAAAADIRVLLIDANLRRPSLNKIFDKAEHPGLADVLLGSVTLANAVQATGIPNLSLLSTGKRDRPAAERFTTPVMGALLAEARGMFDLVLVDVPPAVVAGDAAAIAAHCEGVVLVVRALSEKRGLLARLRNQFGDTGAEFLGVVVNGVRASAGGYFKRNFQVSHEYGREGEETLEASDTKGKGKSKGDKPGDRDGSKTAVASGASNS